MNAHRRPTIDCSQPWIWEAGVTEAEQTRIQAATSMCVQMRTLCCRRGTRMPTVVGVIVSRLEHEVIATALKCFDASFYRPAWWERRACPQTTVAGARPATLSEAAQTHNLERCRRRQICRQGGGLHLTALTITCFPRIQQVAPPCLTVCRTQLVQALKLWDSFVLKGKISSAKMFTFDVNSLDVLTREPPPRCTTDGCDVVLCCTCWSGRYPGCCRTGSLYPRSSKPDKFGCWCTPSSPAESWRKVDSS